MDELTGSAPLEGQVLDAFVDAIRALGLRYCQVLCDISVGLLGKVTGVWRIQLYGECFAKRKP